MPTTINGVGTRYIGKSNCDSHLGVCRPCGRQTNLESYDTRLWFVILFIPIIPLGRKRILDQCGRCRRHYVTDPAQFEASRQQQVSGALAEYNSAPTPERALQVHASLLSFSMHEEAAKFREAVLIEYPESAELYAGLVSHLEQFGRHQDALPLIERLLELHPDLPQARIGVARRRMAQGKLDEARALLDFLEKPGAAQSSSLEPIEALANAFQRQGRHEETLELCKHLLSELPRVGQFWKFRKFVDVSERAIGRTSSILPRDSVSVWDIVRLRNWSNSSPVKKLTAAAIVIGAVMLLLAGVNEYRRWNRTVIVLNDSGKPVDITIDGQSRPRVQQRASLTLSEGLHHVTITGPINDDFDIDLKSGYFERWFKSPAWVIDVGGGTALVEEAVHYSVNPRPADVKFIVGERFHYSPDIDYCFEKPPSSIDAGSHGGEVTKTYLGPAQAPADELLRSAANDGKLDEAMRFGETRLIASRHDESLMDAYMEVAFEGDRMDRAQRFLKSGLDSKPISVPWHRAYQDLDKSVERGKTLAADYDQLLTASPGDAGLLYLRGRVAEKRKDAIGFFQRSLDADPDLTWPSYALAYDAASQGDWRRCLVQAEKAYAKGKGYRLSRRLLFLARLGLQDFAALEAENQAPRAANTSNYGLSDTIDLCEVLVAQDKPHDAVLALERGLDRFPAETRTSEVFEMDRAIVQYMIGDFDAMIAIVANRNTPSANYYRLHGLLAAGHVDSALADDSLAKTLKAPWNALAASLALSIATKADEATTWRSKAAAALDHADSNSRRAAAMLRSAAAPSTESVDEVVLHPGLKALLVADLAIRFPAKRNELADLARRLNVERLPPYQVVRLVTERTP